MLLGKTLAFLLTLALLYIAPTLPWPSPMCCQKTCRRESIFIKSEVVEISSSCFISLISIFGASGKNSSCKVLVRSLDSNTHSLAIIPNESQSILDTSSPG